MAQEEKKVEAVEVLTKKEFSAIAEEIKAKFDESVEKASKFNTSPEDEKAIKANVDKRESVVKFLNAVSEKNESYLNPIHNERAKALNEGTGSAGGYLVPEEFEKSIVKFVDQYNVIRQNSTVLPMSSDVKRLNALATDPTVYIVDELGTITGSSLVFAEPVLTAKKYAGFIDWSTEVMEDSELPLVNLIAERLGIAIASKEQSEFISGVTSGSEGLLAVTGVTALALNSGTAFTNVTWDDLADMQAELAGVSIADSQNAKYYMHSATYNVLRQQKASTSGNYFLPVAPTDKMPAQAWGHEIVICNSMPSATATGTKFVVFADLKKHAFIGDRRGITMKMLDQGVVGSVNLSTQDAEALRVTKRTAFVTALQTGIVTLATN